MADAVLIWGAGAIGASIGAALVPSGVAVTLVDTDRDHVLAMRSTDRGLVIQGGSFAFQAAVDARLPDELSGRWRVVLLCVKSQHTADAVTRLRPFLADDGFVVALQNGLTELTIEAAIGRDATIGGFVNFGADRLEPGRIAFGNHGAMAVGELDGARTRRIDEVALLLQRFWPGVLVTEDIWSFTWGKLAYAALLFAQATGTATIVECLQRPELFRLWRELAGEIVSVAHAEGVRPRAFNGFDPDAFSVEGRDEAAARSLAAMISFNQSSGKAYSGVWRDLAIHHRTTEVDAMYGPVVELGSRHGLACPTLCALIEMVRRIEREGGQGDDNLLRLAGVDA